MRLNREHIDSFLDQTWLVILLLSGLILLLGIWVGFDGNGWQLFQVGLTVLAVDILFGWLGGTFRRMGGHWRYEVERERKLAAEAVEAAAKAKHEKSNRAKEGRCLSCGGKLSHFSSGSGDYGEKRHYYTECEACGNRTNERFEDE